jgi:endosialidase-like protein
LSHRNFFSPKRWRILYFWHNSTKGDLMKNRNVTFTTILIALGCFALLQRAQGVLPAPDGCYPGYTTAEGCRALNFLTTGAGNTGVGWHSLYLVGGGNFNTGVGAGTLVLNTADSNTAVGAAALLLNTSGTQNVAVGTDALVHNDMAGLNTAVGYQALFANVSGLENTAIGNQALLDNIGGFFNVAVGGAALLTNTTGNDNTAVGGGALNDTTGNDNTALGFQAGILATTGDGNVYIGAGMSGVAAEANHTYIRNIKDTSVSGGGTDTVTVNLTTGLIGHLTSSRRYKEDIKPMDKASEALFALRPVTYHYKKEIDATQSPAFGLVAEDVAKVNPGLVACNVEGQPESVHYEMINAMLLNEFLKEHRTVQELKNEIAALTATVKEQAAQLQKVSAQIEVSKAAPQVVVNKP